MSRGERPKAGVEEEERVLISTALCGLTEASPGKGVQPGHVACRMVRARARAGARVR